MVISMEEWQQMQKAADDSAPEIEQVFTQAAEVTATAIVLKEISEALETGNTAAAEEVINWELFAAELAAATLIITNIVQKNGNNAANSLNSKFKLNTRFDLLNPYVVEWIKENSGDMITQITDESRKAIRAIILDAYQSGRHPYKTAREIRQYIGLTERGANAVLNYRKRLESDGKLSPVRIDELTKQYSERLIKDRAVMIARTESIKASNAGQQLLWEDAARNGLINLSTAYKKWIVTPDDRLCPVCRAMKGETVPLNSQFSGGVDHAPRHPRCRCSMSLVNKR